MLVGAHWFLHAGKTRRHGKGSRVEHRVGVEREAEPGAIRGVGKRDAVVAHERRGGPVGGKALILGIEPQAPLASEIGNFLGSGLGADPSDQQATDESSQGGKHGCVHGHVSEKMAFMD